jgi:hypothetical protein
MKQATLPDFLTDAQIELCAELYPNREAIRDRVILPNMAEINRKLGQENDANYLSYAVMYVIRRSKMMSSARASS